MGNVVEKDQRRMPSIDFHVKVFQSFQIPLFSLEVTVVNVWESVFRDIINRFTLVLSAFCSILCRVLIPRGRQRQVGGDAVPDSVADHVVGAAVCADKLPPVQGGDEQMNKSISFSFVNSWTFICTPLSFHNFIRWHKFSSHLFTPYRVSSFMHARSIIH